MKNALHLAFGLSLLVVQAALATFVPMHPFVPNLLLPIVVYLGVDPDVQLVRGAVLTFVLGYFLDVVAGAPTGLFTFVLVATYLVARGAGLRLLLRSVPFQMGLVVVISIAANGVMLALRAIFQPPEAFALVMPANGMLGAAVRFFLGEDALVGAYVTTASTLLASALATGLAAPLVFAVVRRIDGMASRSRSRSSGETGAVVP
jgi:rod shape-determining protein MreD